MQDLTPTVDEEQTLTLQIVDWRNRSAAEQAICLLVLRGEGYVPSIAHALGISIKAVESAVTRLMGQGLLRDNGRLLLH